MKTIHKVCTMMRKHDIARGVGVVDYRCKECPSTIKTPTGRKGKQGCRLIAEEMVNLVRFGNPWGKKYQRSRASWPDRTRYTDKHTKATQSNAREKK